MTDVPSSLVSREAQIDTRFLCSLLRELRIEVLPNVDLSKVTSLVP